MNRWGELFAQAAAHHGVVTYAMAARVRLSAQAVRDRARREGWRPITRGAWLVPGAPDTPWGRASAHLLLLGDRAAVSHTSAAFFHGLVKRAPSRTELLVPWDRRPDGLPGARVRRSRTLRAADVVEVRGIRMTSVPRTLRDRAPALSWAQIYDQITDAEQRKLATHDEFAQTAARLHHGPGSGRFRSVVTQRDADRSDSALERDTRDAARGGGFEPSAGPFPIHTPGGRLWLDVAFPAIWFAIECDGYGFHRDRRSFERDRERWRLARAAGWTLTWVTRRRLREDLDGLLAEIAEAHRNADRSRPAATAAE